MSGPTKEMKLTKTFKLVVGETLDQEALDAACQASGKKATVLESGKTYARPAMGDVTVWVDKKNGVITRLDLDC